MWKERFVLGRFMWINENKDTVQLVKQTQWIVLYNGVQKCAFTKEKKAREYLKKEYDINEKNNGK